MGSGRWFPGSEKELKTMVDSFIAGADVPGTSDRIVAAIAPHAGYVYSGKVAGYAFRALKDNAAAGKPPETVVVLGFSHRMGFRGVALMDGDAVATPLGTTAIDQEAVQALAGHSARIFPDYSPHAGEHSAENEIPFVQAALPGAKLVVGIIGDHDTKTIDELVAALGKLAEKKAIVVVASTDMLHDADYDLVTRTDKETLQKLAAMDDGAVLKTWKPGSQILCGVAPVVTVMRYAKSQGCRQGTVLHYRNSGDDFPESRGSWVVGYGAVVFAAPAASGSATDTE